MEIFPLSDDRLRCVRKETRTFITARQGEAVLDSNAENSPEDHAEVFADVEEEENAQEEGMEYTEEELEKDSAY